MDVDAQHTRGENFTKETGEVNDLYLHAARYNQQTQYTDMILLRRFKLLTDGTALPGVSAMSPALGVQWQ